MSRLTILLVIALALAPLGAASAAGAFVGPRLAATDPPTSVDALRPPKVAPILLGGRAGERARVASPGTRAGAAPRVATREGGR